MSNIVNIRAKVYTPIYSYARFLRKAGKQMGWVEMKKCHADSSSGDLTVVSLLKESGNFTIAYGRGYLIRLCKVSTF